MVFALIPAVVPTAAAYPAAHAEVGSGETVAIDGITYTVLRSAADVKTHLMATKAAEDPDAEGGSATATAPDWKPGNYILACDIDLGEIPQASVNLAAGTLLDGNGYRLLYAGAGVFNLQDGEQIAVRNLQIGSAEQPVGTLSHSVDAVTLWENVVVYAEAEDAEGVRQQIGAWYGSAAGSHTFAGCELHAKVSTTAAQADSALWIGASAASDSAFVFQNCTAFGTVEGTYNVGALLGQANGSVTVSGCVSYADITGAPLEDLTINAGWIALAGSGERLCLENCVNFGGISAPSATNGAAGAFIGDYRRQQETPVLKSCVNYGPVVQGSTAGGLVGWIAGSGPRLELEACVNYGSIGSNSTTGGMIGRGDTWGSPATLIFRSCSNSGRVEGKDGSAGFVGWTKMQAGSSLTFENCTNFGEIIGTVDAGGFIGAANNASDISAVLNDCQNYGGITGTKFAGGMIGVTYHGSSSTAFTDCVNAGTVCSETANAGGLIGDGESANNTFTSCYNFGRAEGPTAGGIAGYVYAGRFEGCLNAGDVTATQNQCGGLCGTTGKTATVIERSANIGNIHGSGALPTGGLLGNTNSAGTSVSESVSFGAVPAQKGSAALGLLVGNGGTAPVGCYYLEGMSAAGGNDGTSEAVSLIDALDLLQTLCPDVEFVMGESAIAAVAPAKDGNARMMLNDARTGLVSAIPGFVGVQNGLAGTGRAGAFRLVGVLNGYTGYCEIGYILTVSGSSVDGAQAVCRYVYSSVLADGQTVTAASAGGAVLYTLVVTGADPSATVTVTPYAVLGSCYDQGRTQNSVELTGDTVTLTCIDGEWVCAD